MKEQFLHTVTNSMLLWFDNYLLDKGEAYTNQTGAFAYYEDERAPNYNAFGSRYKQWVTDSSITGATIPSGVDIDGTFSGRSNDLILDFENGRVLCNAATTSTVTGAFAVKDFSVYFTNEEEDDLIVEKRWVSNPRIPMGTGDYITPYDQAVPAIFIVNRNVKNEGFAFGGLQETTVGFTAIVLADDPFQLDGVLSIFADSKDEVIRRIPMTGHPQTEWGDLKTGHYSYTELKNSFSGETNFFVESVTTAKLSDKARKSVIEELYVGFIDFDIQQHRSRHQ